MPLYIIPSNTKYGIIWYNSPQKRKLEEIRYVSSILIAHNYQLPCYRVHRRLVNVGREQMPVASLGPLQIKVLRS